MNSSFELSKAEIFILGTYHFDPPGTDFINFKVSNILSSEKQEEIIEVVNKLSDINPNKIAVEECLKWDRVLNNSYRQYCNGNYSLNKNEIHQLGLRLAKVMNHSKVYAINEEMELPFEDAMEYAQEFQKDFYNNFIRKTNEIDSTVNNLIKTATVMDVLKYLNTSQWVMENHSLYVDFASIGAGDTYCGAKVLSTWYERNIRIFGNLKSIVEPGDRILVIYGAGHKAILSELVSSCSNMQLREISNYL
ncbi:MAG: DUF5694 domain-containing protein [Clostridiaceae bacterium]